MQKISRSLCCMLALLSCFSVCVSANGHKVDVTSDQVEAFYQEIVDKSFEELRSIGGIFLVVQGDNIICNKAYGYETIQKEHAVQTNQSLFRVGSTSKTFTAVAALQLKERGLLDFNQDITNYLKDTPIKNKFNTPVTMQQLLTHRSGLDTSELMFILNVPKKENTAKKFREDLKFIVKSKPGTVCSYNNYGFALAGIVVEDVSGYPYDEYLRKHIFEPLGMNHSMVNVEETNPHMTKEYTYEKGQFIPISSYDLAVPPAGGIVSTGEDMANYMIALLNEGKLNGKQILKKFSIDELLQTQFRVHSEFDGICTGFYENTILGNKFVAHNGATLGTATQILLDPEHKIGVFYSTNFAVNQEDPEFVKRAMNRINEGFVSSFYKNNSKGIPSQSFHNEQGNNTLQGYYLSERGRNENGIEKPIESTQSYKGKNPK